MPDFTHVKIGIILAFLAILLGGGLGLSFGCCEDSLKGGLRSSAYDVLKQKYGDDLEKANKVIKKSWVYYKRAHLHSQTMGVMAIVFSLLVVWLNFKPIFQKGISILSGLGSLGYGLFWLFAGMRAPGLGSTSAAKESVGLIAQISGGSFFIAGAGLFALLFYKVVLQKSPTASTE